MKNGTRDSSKERQRKKTKFRQSKPWKEFRKNLKKKQKIDPLSLNPLTTTCNCHHFCLDPSKYEDLSNEDNYIMLNKMSHDTVHYLYNIARRNGLYNLMKQLFNILYKMLRINGEYEATYKCYKGELN